MLSKESLFILNIQSCTVFIVSDVQCINHYFSLIMENRAWCRVSVTIILVITAIFDIFIHIQTQQCLVFWFNCLYLDAQEVSGDEIGFQAGECLYWLSKGIVLYSQTLKPHNILFFCFVSFFFRCHWGFQWPSERWVFVNIIISRLKSNFTKSCFWV